VTSPAELSEALCLLSSTIEMPSWIPTREQRNYVSLQNGVLDIDAFLANKSIDECIFDHSAEWFSPWKIAYDMDIHSQCPRFIHFIETAMEGDPERIAILQEWMGYILIHKNPFQRFLAVEGVGGDGKSSYFAAIRAMIGKENVSALPLRQFASQFGLSSTIGKMVNICGETDDTNISEADLKQYTGGDLVHVDRKNRDAVSETSTAKLVLSWNNRPHFKDRSRAIWRRILLVPFNRSVPESEIELGLDDPEYWIAKGEVGGIFRWALEGLHRLMTQRRFTDSAVSRAAIEDYQMELNPAKVFLEMAVEEGSGSRISKSELYRSYLHYCSEGGHRYPLSDRNFGKEVRKHFPAVEDGKISRGPQGRENCYVGIHFKSEEVVPDGKSFW